MITTFKNIINRMDVVLIILSIVIITWLALYRLMVVNEIKQFNNGICKVCGSKLHKSTVEYEDSRLYRCSKCKTTKIWITIDKVDKNFK